MATDKQRGADPERTQLANPFDTGDGIFGQEYDIERERAEGRKHPSGKVNASPSTAYFDPTDRRDIPSDNGRRASFDPVTGEVHGSGSGAGGGNPGEDFDSDSQNGDGYPQTGGEGRSKTTGDLGPPRLAE